MKLLFDQNLSHKLCQQLADLFPGSAHVKQIGLHRSGDFEVWLKAQGGGYVIVSQDSDFADLATFHGPPAKVIWLRGGNQNTRDIEQLFRTRYETILAFMRDPELTCIELY